MQDGQERMTNNATEDLVSGRLNPTSFIPKSTG